MTLRAEPQTYDTLRSVDVMRLMYLLAQLEKECPGPIKPNLNLKDGKNLYVSFICEGNWFDALLEQGDLNNPVDTARAMAKLAKVSGVHTQDRIIKPELIL